MPIVVDANPLISTVRSNLSPLVELTAYARRCGTAVFLPVVARKEFLAYLDRHVTETEQKLGAVAKRLPQSDAVSNHLTGLMKVARAAKKNVTRSLRELEKRGSIRTMPLRGIHARRALERATLRQPPCDQRGEEIRDALIWEAALDLLKHHQGPLMLITADKGFQSEALFAEVHSRGAELILFESMESLLRQDKIEPESIPGDVLSGLSDPGDLATWIAAHVAEDPFDSWHSSISNFVECCGLDRIAGEYKIIEVSNVVVGDGVRRHIDRRTHYAHVGFETVVWVTCEAYQTERRPPSEHETLGHDLPADDTLRKLLSIIPMRVPVGEPELVNIDLQVSGEAVYTVTDGVFATPPLAIYGNPMAAGFHGREMISHRIL